LRPPARAGELLAVSFCLDKSSRWLPKAEAVPESACVPVASPGWGSHLQLHTFRVPPGSYRWHPVWLREESQSRKTLPTLTQA
ncbi:MAG: hypothetical protein ACLP4V_05890, partial [Methylocella sp.]